MGWHSRYIGLPFKDGGRDERGIDCWGLVRIVYQRERNIELPSYGEISAYDLASIAKMVEGESAVDPWRPVEPGDLRDFDVVVMRRRRAPVHVGLIVAPDKLLHIEKGIDSVFIPLDDASVVQRKQLYFRHRSLCG